MAHLFVLFFFFVVVIEEVGLGSGEDILEEL